MTGRVRSGTGAVARGSVRRRERSDTHPQDRPAHALSRYGRSATRRPDRREIQAVLLMTTPISPRARRLGLAAMALALMAGSGTSHPTASPDTSTPAPTPTAARGPSGTPGTTPSGRPSTAPSTVPPPPLPTRTAPV